MVLIIIKYKKLFCWLSVYISIFSCCLGINGQQNNTVITLSSDKIGEISEILFPRITDKFNVIEYEYAMDIRENPSFSAPTHLSIVKLRNGRLLAYKYILGNQELSLGKQLIMLLKNGESDDARNLANHMNVEKRNVVLNKSYSLLIDNFFLKIDSRKSSEITLDGVGYEIWYIDNSSKAYFSLVGSEKFSKGESQTITWAREIMKKTHLQKN